MTLTPADVREYDEQARTATETATFALGCFWGPDAEFGAVDGVVTTRVGYAGGTKRDPSYHALGDQTEALQVDFDPAVVSYTELLDRAFQLHDPHSQTRTTQYQNIVFAATASQRDALTTWLEANGFTADGIETRIERLSQFHLAEDYHQKHSLRGEDRLLNAFTEAGYDDEAIRESPAAAVVNAHAAGHETDGLDLPDRQTVRFR